ncbi:hypothetical protein ACHWQZ_G013626 [Mnemiopsis leidyi]
MLCTLAKRKCTRLGSVLCNQLSDLPFVRRGPDAKSVPLPLFSDVGERLVPNLKTAGYGHYYHVTGQHYTHDPSLTRNIVMKVEESFKPKVILDAALSDSEIKILTNILVDSLECRQISAGEVDSVGSEDWNYGYVLAPQFTIFSSDDILLQQNDQNKELMQLHSRPGFPIGQKIWLKDIENVFVDLSHKPWDVQTLGIRTLADQITLVKKEHKFCDVQSEDNDGDPTHQELGDIMINTEWIVKTAAQLVHVASKNRFKNATIPLYVPRVVQADLNPWVALRNSLWQNEVPDKLQDSQNSYIP